MFIRDVSCHKSYAQVFVQAHTEQSGAPARTSQPAVSILISGVDMIDRYCELTVIVPDDEHCLQESQHHVQTAVYIGHSALRMLLFEQTGQVEKSSSWSPHCCFMATDLSVTDDCLEYGFTCGVSTLGASRCPDTNKGVPKVTKNMIC